MSLKSLSSILDQIPHKLIKGTYDHEVSGIEIDSRLILPGNLFIAIKGSKADGHQFISVAIDRGASAILCHESPEEIIPDGVSLIEVVDSRKIAG